MSGGSIERSKINQYTPNTGGAGRVSTGIANMYRRKPVPISYLKPTSSHGEVRIIKPADPEKVAKLEAKK